MKLIKLKGVKIELNIQEIFTFNFLLTILKSQNISNNIKLTNIYIE